jgi:anti-anti-sigma regulatory factor
MVEVAVTRRPDGCVVVRIDGEVDLGARLPAVETLNADADSSPVVVDLCGVRFFSLAGVDWVNGAVAALTTRGRTVRVVCAAPGPVWRLVTLLGLQRRWSVHHRVADAVATLGEPR